MANYRPHEHEQRDEVAAAIDDDDGVPAAAAARLLLDGGRVLVLCGALASVGMINHPPAAAAAHNAAACHGALVGLLLWLLGVSFLALALVPAAPRFLRAARFGAAVLACFFPPWY